MLNAELLKLATDRIHLEFKERSRLFEREVARIKEESADRGAFEGSAMWDAIIDQIRLEFDVRAMLAWQILSRILSGQKMSIELSMISSLKTELTEHLSGLCDDLEIYHREVALKADSFRIPAFEKLLSTALAKIHFEIEISLLTAIRNQSTSDSTAIFNIYHSYGVVQTGPGATATVIQGIQANHRTHILRALEAVEKLAIENTALSSDQRTQIQEVVADAQDELKKDTPNRLKIQGMELTRFFGRLWACDLWLEWIPPFKLNR